MKPLTKISVRWLKSCLIFFLASCSSQAKDKNISAIELQNQAFEQRAFQNIYELKKCIHNGDIITRQGNDFTSQSLRKLNRRNANWSHIGIASIEHDSIFIYHALGGEWNPDEKIKRDFIEDFAEPFSNNGISIYRFQIEDSLQEKITTMARAFKNAGIRFDMDFDLKTDDKMYCAEYVYKVLIKASNNTLAFHHSHINTFEFIGVDDIFLHPQCRQIKTYMYK